MVIDRSHKRWAVASAVILVVASVAYVRYASGPVPPSGGRGMGLIYGSVGFAFMSFATLLSVRKKFPIWRIGRAETWMRGHLWLGVLSLPLIVLHAGSLSGHGLAAWLMWLFAVVWASGLVGAYLQHVVPRRMLREVPMETIYEQIGHVRAQLVDEADTVVADACGRLDVVTEVPAAPAVTPAKATLATAMRRIVRARVHAARLGVLHAQVATRRLLPVTERMQVQVAVRAVADAEAAADAPVLDDDLHRAAPADRPDRTAHHAERIPA